MTVFRDINGREIRPGDLVRVLHYRDRRTGRHVYMYKLVVRVDEELHVAPNGQWLYLLEVCDIAGKELQHAHKCRLEDVYHVEIVDGIAQIKENGELECWYERPKVKNERDVVS